MGNDLHGSPEIISPTFFGQHRGVNFPGSHVARLAARNVNKALVVSKIEIRLGPIAVSYRGRVTLQNIDADGHRLEIKAQGVESRGRGGASSTTTAELTPSDAGTSVVMSSELQVSGVVAQFGRSGIMQEVAQRLTQRFGSCVEQQLKAAATAG